MKKTIPLTQRRCLPILPGTPPLTKPQVATLLAELPSWAVVKGALERTFGFKNYYQTLAFVNAVAWIAHREDHHPDLAFGYKSCTIRYATHSIGGLSENDFISAARVDALGAGG